MAAVGMLLNRERLDRAFWKYCIGEYSTELWDLRAARQAERHKIAQSIISVTVACGTLFHLSRFDFDGALVPALSVGSVQLPRSLCTFGARQLLG